jgi:hypothetical protein
VADRYVDSNAAGAADGTTWADAFTTLAAAAAVDVAGDNIWVASDHSESTAGNVLLSWAGTAASPTRIISADKTSGAPPATMQAGASVAATGANNITVFNSGFGYAFGITFGAGNGGTTGFVSVNGSTGDVVCEQCSFKLVGSGATARINLSNNPGGKSKLVDCTFKFASTSQAIRSGTLTGTSAQVTGGSILSGGSAIAQLLNPSDGQTFLFDGFDLSNAAATADIVSGTSENVFVTLRNCKLPASWSGNLCSAVIGVGSIINLHGTDSTDTNYRLAKGTIYGNVVHETTLVRSDGASDGTTSLSWNMTSTADAEWNHQTLDSPEIVRWNETVGSAITATIEILHDSATNIQDDEIWMEMQYLGTSGVPLSLFVDDAAADYLATPADQADSSASWTTTGMTNPNTQKLSVTFTPQEKGFIHAVVKLAKASYTVYVDPKITVS